jgi:hypothetical protein
VLASVVAYVVNIVPCRVVSVTDIVSSRFDLLDLLGVSITISLDYVLGRFLGGKERTARKADNLTAICEPIV